MIKLEYTITTLSSLIVSPRSDRAFYRELDDSIEAYCYKNDEEYLDGNKLKIIYPFYRYGEYDSYAPEQAEYYLPGSSLKGALTNSDGKREKTDRKLMVDDAKIENNSVVLRNLYKLQYVNDEKKKTCFERFFDNVGVEMVKAKTELKGELYAEEANTVKDLLKSANDRTRQKIEQMSAYLQGIKSVKAKKMQDGHAKVLATIIANLEQLKQRTNIILLGGYKGLLHSICLNNDAGDINSAVFVDMTTNLPHGLVSIDLEVKNN